MSYVLFLPHVLPQCGQPAAKRNPHASAPPAYTISLLLLFRTAFLIIIVIVIVITIDSSTHHHCHPFPFQAKLTPFLYFVMESYLILNI
jgi:hypothetical protein